jgi:hypothetical protein
VIAPEIANVPHIREAPAEVVAALREIHPAATLLYHGRGKWGLYLYAPDAERQGQARVRLDHLNRAAQPTLSATAPEKRAHKERLLAGVYAVTDRVRQGFQLVRVFEQNDADSRIVEWFRQADWKYRNLSANELEADFARRSGERGEDDETPASKALTDPDRAKEAWRWAFKRPVSVLSAGIPSTN